MLSSIRPQSPLPPAPSLLLQNNRTGLALTFLGTGGVLSGAGGRCAPGLALNRVKDVWMVDAGEDVQRQMMWVEHLRPSKVGSCLERG